MTDFFANFVRAIRQERLRSLGVTVWPAVTLPFSVMPLAPAYARSYLVESEPLQEPFSTERRVQCACPLAAR